MKYSDLGPIVKNAKARYQSIREKYPNASGYLVFALKGNQAKTGEDAISFLRSFPSFFADSDARRLAQENLARLKALEKAEKKDQPAIDQLLKKIQESCTELEINPAVQIEIRWDDLDFEVVKALRADAALIDIARTPQLGGILIVLGLITEFT